MNAGRAFFQMVLSKQVVYVEDALAWYKHLQQDMDWPPVNSVDELCESLQAFFSKLPKFGYQIKMGLNPLDMRPTQCGRFFAIVNTIKDSAVNQASMLANLKEQAFFYAIVSELLQEGDVGACDIADNGYIARALTVSALRDPEWIRAITPRANAKSPLLPRDIDELLNKLTRDHWLTVTKLSGDESRAVWFGPRAIVELPAVASELRRRERAGRKPPAWKVTPRSSRFAVIDRSEAGAVADDPDGTPPPALSEDHTRTQRRQPRSELASRSMRTPKRPVVNGRSANKGSPVESQRGLKRPNAPMNGHSPRESNRRRRRVIIEDSEDENRVEPMPARIQTPSRSRSVPSPSSPNDEETGYPSSDSSVEIRSTMQGSSESDD